MPQLNDIFTDVDSFINNIKFPTDVEEKIFIISYENDRKIDISYLQATRFFIQIDEILRNLIECKILDEENTVIFSAFDQNAFGVLFCIYSLINRVLFVPLDHFDRRIFTDHIVSMRGVFRKVLILSKTVFDIEQTLNSVDFVEVNYKTYKKVDILSRNYFIDIHVCELMSSKAPAYRIVSDHFPLIYASYSSGTTGLCKSILVTYSSFIPCLTESVVEFGISSDSIVILTSPFTFDPSILQIIWVLFCKGKLVSMDRSVKISPIQISKILAETKVTHLQCTPSFLYTLPSSNIKNIFDIGALKHIIFGGECFPSFKWLKSITDDIKHQPIFVNLYGTTEISPWSSFFILTPTFLEQYLYDPSIEVPIIGRFFPETHFSLVQTDDNQLELLLGSASRLCVINGNIDPLINFKIDSNHVHYITTNDLVNVKDSCIYFKSRKSDSIKRNGKLINLTRMKNNVISNLRGILSDCIFISASNDEKAELLFFYIPSTVEFEVTDLIVKHLSNCLTSHEIPDKVICLREFFYNHNGKLDTKKLISLSHNKILDKKDKISIRDVVVKFLCSILNIDDITANEDNFIENGGDSIKMASLLNKIELFFSRSKNGFDSTFLIHVLLSKPLVYFVDTVENLFLAESQDKDDEEVCPMWTVNTDKCVDALPCVFEKDDISFILIGTHSGMFLCIDICSGEIVWRTELGARIVSECVVFKEYSIVAIGAFDYNIYFLDIDTGNMVWVFPTEGVIKAPLLLLNKDLLVGLSYDSYVYLINVESKTSTWKICIDGKILPSKPAYSEELECIFVGTAGGHVCSISLFGEIKWIINLNSPIFSSVYVTVKGILVAEVNGRINLVDCQNGDIIMSSKVNGNVYCDLYILKDENCFYVTCQNGFVSKLSIENMTEIGSFSVDCVLFSPVIIIKKDMKESFILVVCSNGILKFYDLIDHKLLKMVRTQYKFLGKAILHERSLILPSTNNQLHRIPISF